MKNIKDINIGAAIIVKDAEETIERTIKSIESVCRQIVVVDTGSSDSTPAIAIRLGADVSYFRWVEDFSAARNYSLSLLRTEWVLIIDSDETLNNESLIMHKEMFHNEKTGGIKVLIKNHLENGKALSEHYYTRIFRVNPEIRFTGKIHEQILDSIYAMGFEIVDSDIVIDHFGYMERTNDKFERNIELLRNELIQNPNDQWLKYHLGEALFAKNDFNEAKVLFLSLEYSIQLTQDQKERVLIRISQIALQENNFDEVENKLDFISMNTNTEGLRKYILAVSYLMQKRLSEAKKIIISNDVKESGLVNKDDLQKVLNIIEDLEIV